jgi:hypothetical protein
VTWEIAPGEAERIAALPADDRATLTLQLIADWGEAWGLRDAEGWIVQRRPDGDALPLWPHPELAAPCAQGRWEGAKPDRIELDELLEDLIPLLLEDGLRVHLCPTRQGDETLDGTLLAPDELASRLEDELAIGEPADPTEPADPAR